MPFVVVEGLEGFEQKLRVLARQGRVVQTHEARLLSAGLEHELVLRRVAVRPHVDPLAVQGGAGSVLFDLPDE